MKKKKNFQKTANKECEQNQECEQGTCVLSKAPSGLDSNQINSSLCIVPFLSTRGARGGYHVELNTAVTVVFILASVT